MASVERKIIISCDGEILTPEDFTNEVIQRNPGVFTDEQKAFLNTFWNYATYNI